MATLAEIQNKLKALENSDLTDSEIYRQLKAEEAKLGSPVAKASAKAVAKAPAKAGAEFVNLDVEVDQESFESGGMEFDAPSKPDIYTGEFNSIIYPATKENQFWLVFKTNDDRILADKGRQVISALTITPKRAGETKSGAFKLSQVLNSLNIPYDNTTPGRVIANIPKGLPCMMQYEEIVDKGKTKVRLQSVWAKETTQSQAV